MSRIGHDDHLRTLRDARAQRGVHRVFSLHRAVPGYVMSGSFESPVTVAYPISLQTYSNDSNESHTVNCLW